MKRANGFAMIEMLVAVGIGAMIVAVMVYLQVDMIGWANRAMAMGRPDPSDRGMLASARAVDRCALPGGVLTVAQGSVALLPTKVKDRAAAAGLDAIPFLGLPANTRARVETAKAADGTPRPGWSMASVARDDRALAVVGLRCDLPQVCRYDAQKGNCGEK